MSAATRNPEFIQPENAQALVWNMLRDWERVDVSGEVQPLEMTRVQDDPELIKGYGPEIEPLQITGQIVPRKEDYLWTDVSDDRGGKAFARVPWHLGKRFYTSLAGRETIHLDKAQVEELETAQTDLLKTLGQKNYAAEWTADQDFAANGAYHIKNNVVAEPEFAKTRIYVASGISAMHVVKRTIEKGAQFSYAKVWTPALQPGEQQFRDDTPIFETQTTFQLMSTIRALRKVYREEGLGTNDAILSPLGQPVEELPGVTIGQTAKGESFNGTMMELFAEPLREACLTTSLLADGRIGAAWIATAAAKMTESARANAQTHGVHENHHAFLAGERVEALLDAIKAA